jgi:Pyruvate/2-oxoacid:ferredoxin oxidoreductase delta subunit
VDEYLRTGFDLDVWRRAPQLRTIPVAESIDTPNAVLPYEQAREIIRNQKKILVADCICRKERNLVGEGCEKPLETCLIFGGGAHFYERYGMGRPISVDEALAVLDTADRAGLVLQPTNAQEPIGMCCCCGDCCGVLRNVKRHPKPASIVSSAFRAECETEICAGCGDCVGRCQMEAIDLEQGYATINYDRCIGCGLCVTTCSTEAMRLVRKPESEQPYVPRDIVENTLRIAKHRQVIKNSDLVMMAVKSKVDRLAALKKF